MFYAFEWDSRKAATNLKKHGIDFADAATALYDESAITIQDDCVNERRFITIGMDALGRVSVVICPRHGNRIRIISARKTTPGERLQYERNL
ncbi:MAG: BrnT family toxin [Acidobacteriota bacterium]